MPALANRMIWAMSAPGTDRIVGILCSTVITPAQVVPPGPALPGVLLSRPPDRLQRLGETRSFGGTGSCGFGRGADVAQSGQRLDRGQHGLAGGCDEDAELLRMVGDRVRVGGSRHAQQAVGARREPVQEQREVIRFGTTIIGVEVSGVADLV